jgi:hypothetical protein
MVSCISSLSRRLLDDETIGIAQPDVPGCVQIQAVFLFMLLTSDDRKYSQLVDSSSAPFRTNGYFVRAMHGAADVDISIVHLLRSIGRIAFGAAQQLVALCCNHGSPSAAGIWLSWQ